MPEERSRGLIERFLGLFSDVRGGEGANVLLMFANIFLILTAYYALKVVRESLTIGGVQLFGLGGDEIKAYLPAVMAVLLLGVVPLYSAVASAVSRIRLINGTTLLVMGTLGLRRRLHDGPRRVGRDSGQSGRRRRRSRALRRPGA